MDTEDVDSSGRYNSPAESDGGDDTANFNTNANNDPDEDIMNQCGPAIELYRSQLKDTDENDSVDCDDETSPTNRALECEEDEYWANQNSGESYLEDSAEEDATVYYDDLYMS